MKKCNICKRILNIPGNVWSADCGGDCFSCTEGTLEERLQEIAGERGGNVREKETAQLAIEEIELIKEKCTTET